MNMYVFLWDAFGNKASVSKSSPTAFPVRAFLIPIKLGNLFRIYRKKLPIYEVMRITNGFAYLESTH